MADREGEGLVSAGWVVSVFELIFLVYIAALVYLIWEGRND